MLTGQRRGEVAALLETYYSHNQQTVTLPRADKNHLEHTFPGRGMAVQTYIGADRGRPDGTANSSSLPHVHLSGHSTVVQVQKNSIRLR